MMNHLALLRRFLLLDTSLPPSLRVGVGKEKRVRGFLAACFVEEGEEEGGIGVKCAALELLPSVLGIGGGGKSHPPTHPPTHWLTCSTLPTFNRRRRGGRRSAAQSLTHLISSLYVLPNRRRGRGGGGGGGRSPPHSSGGRSHSGQVFSLVVL